MTVMNACGIPTKLLLGLEVAAAERDKILCVIAGRFRERKKTLVVYANTNLLYLSRKANLVDRISSECIVLNDGLGLDLISVISGLSRFSENLNGTDFTLKILNVIDEDARIFCFGSQEDVLRSAATRLSQLHSLHVVGSMNGFIEKSLVDTDLIDKINDLRSDVVLVGLGNIRQEEWMLKHADRLTARIIVGVGAFFDFTAGSVYRAPLWARRLRLEWVFRLLQEPARLWRRYTIDPAALALTAIWRRF